MLKKGLLLIYLAFLAHGFGFDLDKTQITIQAKIYPQLIFFDSKMKESPGKQVLILAVYSDYTKRYAEQFKEECERLYPNGIKGYPVVVKTVSIDKISQYREYSAAYLIFDDSDTNALQYIKSQKGVITFAGNRRIFEKNAAIFFVEITNKTAIILNKKALNASGLSFDSSLLKLTKVHDE